MRLTIGIHDSVITKLLILSEAKNKTEAVNYAIRYFIKKCAKEKLLKLKGKLHIEENWKSLRKAELDE
jgi:hypothetical protein